MVKLVVKATFKLLELARAGTHGNRGEVACSVFYQFWKRTYSK